MLKPGKSDFLKTDKMLVSTAGEAIILDINNKFYYIIKNIHLHLPELIVSSWF